MVTRRVFLTAIAGIVTAALIPAKILPARGPVWCKPASEGWVCGIESVPYNFGQKVVEVFNYQASNWIVRMRRGNEWDLRVIKIEGDLSAAKRTAARLWQAV